jgi:hypothetical protein
LKLKLVALTLIAFACWLVPYKTLAEEIGTPKQKVEEVTPPVNENNSPTSPPNKPEEPSKTSTGVGGVLVRRTNGAQMQTAYNGRHSTRAEKQISEQSLEQYLSAKGSPLALYSPNILASPYWSTIIGICTIEQYGCTRAPGNNYWGIGPGRTYPTPEAGIHAISDLLAKYETDGKHTSIESLNGFYVQPASNNWLQTVLKTKAYLESLE